MGDEKRRSPFMCLCSKILQLRDNINNFAYFHNQLEIRGADIYEWTNKSLVLRSVGAWKNRPRFYVPLLEDFKTTE